MGSVMRFVRFGETSCLDNLRITQYSGIAPGDGVIED